MMSFANLKLSSHPNHASIADGSVHPKSLSAKLRTVILSSPAV